MLNVGGNNFGHPALKMFADMQGSASVQSGRLFSSTRLCSECSGHHWVRDLNERFCFRRTEAWCPAGQGSKTFVNLQMHNAAKRTTIALLMARWYHESVLDVLPKDIVRRYVLKSKTEIATLNAASACAKRIATQAIKKELVLRMGFTVILSF